MNIEDNRTRSNGDIRKNRKNKVDTRNMETCNVNNTDICNMGIGNTDSCSTDNCNTDNCNNRGNCSCTRNIDSTDTPELSMESHKVRRPVGRRRLACKPDRAPDMVGVAVSPAWLAVAEPL